MIAKWHFTNSFKWRAKLISVKFAQNPDKAFNVG
jgi:hypothetical protein